MRRTTLATLLLLATLACRSTPPQPGEPGYEEALRERARRVHEAAFVIETHADTTPKFETDWDFAARHDEGHVDVPRLREGGFDGVFWSIWMGPTPGDGTATKRAVRRIDSVYEAARRWPEHLAVATSADDVRRASREGKIACLIGVEGGHMIEDDLAVLRTYRRLGARYMTLTHSFNTSWADSAGTDRPVPPTVGGLNELGRDVVREMNRIGLMVDVSHVADSTFWDVLAVAEAPVIATHSSCRAVADHPRNLTDEMIRAIADTGGVVQINFYPGYVDPQKTAMARELLPEVEAIYARHPDDPRAARAERIELFARHDPGPTPASVVVDHIEHVIELVGADHVGLGADWDGVPDMPVGLEDCSKLEYVTRELLRRGHSESDVEKVLGGNVLRVLDDVDAAARRLAANP